MRKAMRMHKNRFVWTGYIDTWKVFFLKLAPRDSVRYPILIAVAILAIVGVLAVVLGISTTKNRVENVVDGIDLFAVING